MNVSDYERNPNLQYRALMEPLNLKAKLFRGFSAPSRLAILESLKDVEKTGSEVASLIGQSQTNVSNHLIYLLECGIVKKRRDGKSIYYSIKDWRFLRFLSDSDAILAEALRSSRVRIMMNKDSNA